MIANQDDVVDHIIADHREAEEVFKEIEKSDEPLCRHALVEHVITELVRHSVAEEQYLYPAARRSVPDGDNLIDHEIEEHAAAEEVMKDLHQSDPHHSRYGELVDKLMEDIRHHIDDEEEDLLPELRKVCEAAELQALGDKFEKSKHSAPTRPHPSAPDTPPANKILAPGLGLIDRMRDAVSDRAG